MPNRKPDFAIILIAVFLLSLTIFIYAGTYIAVYQFLAQRFQSLPAAMMSLLLAFIFTSTCIVLLLEREDTNRTMAWLLVLLAFPVIGFLLYIIFGQRLIRRQKVIRRLRRTHKEPNPLHTAVLFHDEERHTPLLENAQSPEDIAFADNPVHLRLSRLIYNSSGAMLTYSNWVHILNDGISIFPAMLAAIADAKHHIHLQSYIFREDELGKAFLSILAEKAAAGVQVRIILDGIGSLGLERMRERMAELEAQGVHIRFHFPIRFTLFRNRLNYRNHRKILVVDGKTAFVGGANVGDDYLGLYPTIGNWRDTQLLIHGPAAAELQRIFFQDWITISGEMPGDNPGRFFPGFTEADNLTATTAFKNYPSSLKKVLRVVSEVLSAHTNVPDADSTTMATAENNAEIATEDIVDGYPASSIEPSVTVALAVNEEPNPSLLTISSAHIRDVNMLPGFVPAYNKAVQIAASGPDSPYASIMQSYHYAISNAKDVINITSPYFIPNQSILTDLKTAALAGVEINLLVPRNPDHQMVYLAAMTYIEELMEDGVKVWLYHKGFLHSKIVTVDDSIAIVGTSNMDQRSFILNFEVNAMIYDKHTVDELNEAFQRDLADATPLELSAFRQRPLLRRILESGCRLLSPLL